MNCAWEPVRLPYRDCAVLIEPKHRLRLSVRPGPRPRPACPRRNPPQPGGGLPERICPVEAFSIVPRRLAGGGAPRPPGGDVTKKRILRDAGAADCAFPRGVGSGYAPPWGRTRVLLAVPAPSPAGPGDRCAPAVARDVVADVRSRPVGEGIMPHVAGDGRRARAAAHGSPQPGAGPRAGDGSSLCPAG